MNVAFIQDQNGDEIAKRQQSAISNYAELRGMPIDNWQNASAFNPESLGRGDVLLLEKTFRLAKDVASIAKMLAVLLKRGVTVYSCADGVLFDGNLVSATVMTDMFEKVAALTEELRSRLTKESLDLRRSAGQKLGRPYGALNKRTKLSGREIEIAQLLQSGYSRRQIAIRLHVAQNTLATFLKRTPELAELIDA